MSNRHPVCVDVAFVVSHGPLKVHHPVGELTR